MFSSVVLAAVGQYAASKAEQAEFEQRLLTLPEGKRAAAIEQRQELMKERVKLSTEIAALSRREPRSQCRSPLAFLFGLLVGSSFS